MARIMADPTQMRSFANRIGSSATDFKSNYTQMYNVIDNLKSAWTGADNQAFANKINSYKKEFDAMHQAIESYKEFLDKSAKAYKDAQEAISKAAGQL